MLPSIATSSMAMISTPSMPRAANNKIEPSLSIECNVFAREVLKFEVGDHVFSSTGFNFGTHADFVRVRESARIAVIPTGLSFKEFAAI